MVQKILTFTISKKKKNQSSAFGYEKLQQQLHVLQGSSQDVNSFSESDIEGAAQEFNLIDSNNNELKKRIKYNVYLNKSTAKKLLSLKFCISLYFMVFQISAPLIKLPLPPPLIMYTGRILNKHQSTTGAYSTNYSISIQRFFVKRHLKLIVLS